MESSIALCNSSFLHFSTSATVYSIENSDCMRENTTKIRNIKQYLKAALFNAPSTIGNYYTSLVAHDMASGALSPKKPQYGDPDYYSCNEGESL